MFTIKKRKKKKSIVPQVFRKALYSNEKLIRGQPGPCVMSQWAVAPFENKEWRTAWFSSRPNKQWDWDGNIAADLSSKSPWLRMAQVTFWVWLSEDCEYIIAAQEDLATWHTSLEQCLWWDPRGYYIACNRVHSVHVLYSFILIRNGHIPTMWSKGI